jgi:hypothetical protein
MVTIGSNTSQHQQMLKSLRNNHKIHQYQQRETALSNQLMKP